MDGKRLHKALNQKALLALSVFPFLLLGSLPAHALYKCSGPHGTSYSDQACAAGTAGAELAPPAAPDAAAVRQAEQRSAQEQARLRQLASERERRQAQEESARARAEAGRQAHQKKCKLLEMKKRWGEEDAASATLKREAHARRSARRKAEQYALECGG